MADSSNLLHVQICYAKAELQILHDITVPAGTTLQDAILQSDILKQEAQIDLTVCYVGIYGKLKPFETILRDHDRIEIYRPLTADPKESRRTRVLKKGDKKAR